ncbi:response regulator transcription factor [Mycobacterium sp. CBMA293]|uniref:response regulator transcription factor n=1 Tax=unclassified Mycolicibacterium TaxID=2636767 RepID=UPI0012DD9283|nr:MULTISPECIES: response regulator transcription factor [unclassified Mycolicibacterium]MUL48676.1 response regulator transcription factor [Mycolicibacterium sp. CBMA 360]MUL60826.1 response regulator transcription factor [Mycolicibacterium sp. CBMA 335]MUL71839.1 response regulator transcription factor [Mycolicibacterium sp. CBMA 311]MUL95767.1 response regulator transcription factor [Mycolicibacterium sp. CBMA 230]MUM06365.1 LuxR family transcriptional regulator [Mycolicibacterium sp. CBMA 
MPAPADRPKPLAIAVVDDHDVIHTGIAAWCAQATPPIRVASDHLDAESFLAAYPQAVPDLTAVILDLELRSRQPDFDAVSAIADAGHAVIVYSHLENAEVILRCLGIGVVTYLAKSEGQGHLIEAIKAASTHEPYVGPRMAAAICSDTDLGRPGLTEREREVLKAWFQTESKDIVAKRLHLAPTTVRTHLQRVRAKYAAAGRPAATKAQLVARAVQDGILSVEDL